MYRSLSSSSRYSASPPTSTLSTSHASQSGGGGNHSSHGGVASGSGNTSGGGNTGSGSGSGGGGGGSGSSYGSSSRSSLSGAGAHRLEQILQNFYLKTAQIITQSRQSGLNHHGSERSRDLLRQPSLDTLSGTSTHRSSSGQSRRVNKWFNMEMEDTDDLRDELKLWRATAVLSVSPPPPMIIEVFVDCSHLAPSQVPVLLDGDQGRKAKVEGIGGNGTHMGFGGQHRRNTILLESWQLTLDAQASSSSLPELPTLYKRCIMFFRALYTYTRLLPAYRLCRRLRRSMGQSIPLRIDYRFTTASSVRPDEIQLEMPLTDLEPRNITNTHRFESVDTPAGLFSLQVTYRQYCELTVNDPEQLLSSRLVDMEENFFSPSLAQESRMRTLLQRDRKRDGELSMPSSPVNTSMLHSQPWRSGSPLRPMPASYPNPPPGAFFALGNDASPTTAHAMHTASTNATYTDQLSGVIGTSILPLDDSPIFNSSPISTESRMRTLISQTPSYTEAPLPFSNPIDMHRIDRRSSRGSMRSVASRSSSRPSSIISSSPRDNIHTVHHRASTSSGSTAMTVPPHQLASHTGEHSTSSTANSTTNAHHHHHHHHPSSASNIYAGMVMDRSSSGRPPSFTSMSPHDVFPPRGSPASKGSPSLQAVHPTTNSQGDGVTSNSPQPTTGILPSFTLPFAASIPTQRLSGASISSQDVVPPRTLPVHTGSNTLMRRASNSQSGTARRGRSNTRQSDESIHSERRLSRGSVRSFTASVTQKDVDDVASFVHMIDTHMSIPLNGGGHHQHQHHDISGGLSVLPVRSSSEQSLSMGMGNGSSTSLLQGTDHALSRFHQFRDEAMLLTESMQLGHALNSPSSQHVHLTSANLPITASTGSSIASISAATGRGRPTSRPTSTNLILPHRRTPSNSSNSSSHHHHHHHSEQPHHESVTRRSRANTLDNDRDNNNSSSSTTLPFASSTAPLGSTSRSSTHPPPPPPDSPSMKCAPLLIMDRPSYHLPPTNSSDVSLPLPSTAVMTIVESSRDGASVLATDTHRSREHQALSDEALLHGDDPQPDTSLLSQPSREFGGNSLEDEGMIFGLADLSFGERSTGSGGAVGSHRPPHW